MPKPSKNFAKIDIVKAVAGVSFATLAAIGGTTGNPMIAGLSALPAAGLASYDIIGDRLLKLKGRKEQYLELPSPHWWTHDARTWQELCTEIENLTPRILQVIQERMQQEQQVITKDIVRQIFIEAFTAQHLPWQPGFEQKRLVGEFIATPFLQKLDEILKPVIEQAQQEGVLLDHRKTALYTEHTVDVLEKIHQEMSQAKETHSLSNEEIAYLHKQYCETLYTRWKMLDFKGIMHVDMNRPISIPLIEVFVFTDVLPGVPEYETLERENEELLYGNHPRHGAKRTPPQRETLYSVLMKHRRLVLVGDPGSGKSTLLRYLLLQLAQGSENFTADSPMMSEIVSSVPLYMPLASYVEVLLSNAPGNRSLDDFLPKYLHENYLGAYVEFIQGQLERGNVLLLFDGLDEIPDTSLRLKVARHIEMFTQFHAKNRFIVTSRIVGYKEAPLSSEYQPYTLADFSEEQVRTFAQRWCPAYEYWVRETREGQYLEDAATKEAEKLFQATQSKPGVKRLAVNPLLLTILALIQRQGIDLPSHRVELFELCAMTLIDTWVKARGQSIHLSKNELIKILRPLAFWMHEHKAVGAIPEEEIHEQIVQQLITRSINEYDAERLAEQFLKTVRGKTGILVERGKERYGFLHLTFEEYFAALELEKRKDRNAFIKQHLHHPRWREVILLTVGAIGILRSNEEEVTELVWDTIAKAGSPYEWALHRDLLFAGYCLADDVGVRLARENEILEQIIYLTLTSPYDGLHKMCSSVLASWKGTRIGEKAAMFVLPLLHSWATSADEQQAFSANDPFKQKLVEHVEHLTDYYKEETERHLRFQLVLLLARLQALEGIDWVGNMLSLISDEHKRVKVLRTLEDEQNLPSLIDVLLTALSDPDADVREKVISALGYIGSAEPRVINALLTALTEYMPVVRRAAIRAVGRLGENQEHIINALLAMLAAQPYTKEAAIDALYILDNTHSEVVDALLLALVDRDEPRIRHKAARVLSKLEDGNDQTIDAVITAISHPTRETGATIARILGKLSSNSDHVVDRLCISFSHPALVKEVAIRMLGYLGQARLQETQILCSILTEDNREDIKRAAIQALGQRKVAHPQVIDALLPVLTRPSLPMRREGIEALEQLECREPRVIDALLSTCSDASWYIREAAVHALAHLGGSEPRFINTIRSALNDPHARVRLAAALAYGQLVQTEPLILDTLLSLLVGFRIEDVADTAIGALLQLSKGRSDEVMSYLLAALSTIADGHLVKSAVDNHRQNLYDSIIERVLSLLKDVESNQPHLPDMLFTIIGSTDFSKCPHTMRFEASKVLGRLGKKDPHIIEALLSALSKPNEDLRMFAVMGFVELEKGEPSVINTLLTALSDPASFVGAYSAEALGKLGKGHSIVTNVLSEMLIHPRGGVVTCSVAEALGQLGEARSDIINALLQALFSDSRWTRLGASAALGKLGKGLSSVTDVLIPALSNPYSSFRETAARTLGLLEDKQPVFIDALLPLLSDPHWFVREESARALGVLDDKLSRSCDALLSTLSDASSDVKYAAAYAFRNSSSEDRRISDALLRTLSDSDWYIRGAAAYALANSQSASKVIGTHIETLLRQYEPLAQRNLDDDNFIFDALRSVAEKEFSSK